MLGSMQTALIIGGAIVLLVMLLSACAYKPIKVFIQQHHLHHKLGDQVHRPKRIKRELE